MSEFKAEVGKPIRFLAIEWREDWEFDNPACLVEPVFRYSPNGTPLENMIEDAAIDIAINTENDEGTTIDLSPGDLKEFEWRGWTADAIRAAAEAKLRGEDVKLGTQGVIVEEVWLVFRDDDGDGQLEFYDVPAPKGGV